MTEEDEQQPKPKKARLSVVLPSKKVKPEGAKKGRPSTAASEAGKGKKGAAGKEAAGKKDKADIKGKGKAKETPKKGKTDTPKGTPKAKPKPVVPCPHFEKIDTELSKGDVEYRIQVSSNSYWLSWWLGAGGDMGAGQDDDVLRVYGGGREGRGRCSASSLGSQRTEVRRVRLSHNIPADIYQYSHEAKNQARRAKSDLRGGGRRAYDGKDNAPCKDLAVHLADAVPPCIRLIASKQRATMGLFTKRRHRTKTAERRAEGAAQILEAMASVHTLTVAKEGLVLIKSFANTSSASKKSSPSPLGSCPQSTTLTVRSPKPVSSCLQEGCWTYSRTSSRMMTRTRMWSRYV